MKKIFSLAACAFLTATSFGVALTRAENTFFSEEEKIIIISDKSKIKDDERSIFDQPIIEAYLCPETNTVRVSLYNIGTATIGIVDAWNHVFDHDIIDSTEIPTTVHLSTSGLHGTYYIVIYSDCCYAEGTFTI
ncbi:MAG: hypothetical protein K2G18_05530 [Bacteroidales bacterium]|nr:hypothetical protein [Bacteroidales bacterium]